MLKAEVEMEQTKAEHVWYKAFETFLSFNMNSIVQNVTGF